ncbi:MULTISPECIES: HU family DNA-binding protein [Reichenbachiella]|uniref:DNA-binding protein, histone-like, putative n=1 Tax=Reichenbachiella agariperforans TaxID=156994 RepID=A0A1M6KSC6_REIAG|nr:MULTISPECIES: HU family DNA-binding protein [Reichenbachiella]MBU2913667.1 DsbA family protein [Reichenbachiella agariperforans]RJE74382.1 hypothetical protein BGP76_14565 [Reichenbachiella sp. MSK19-1]SHJ61849.1 DNA-binding protein, histone-like, putative [Reichenbachiella agariperforans]
MSVTYKVTERVDPRDLTLPKKFYARIINGDDVNFEELASIISKVSNLNYGSVVGTLATLIEVIEMQLVHGRQVRLSNLGTFFMTLNSDGVESQEDFRVSNIKNARIRFRPGPRLKRLMRNLDFERTAVLDASTTTAA